ncbi:hypothetical protein L7F22_034066 [Adiantum nelumboides]|nr:hypothetical protein [Adiantum nelumboides]
MAKRSVRAAVTTAAIRAAVSTTRDDKSLDLTPENVKRVLIDARNELLQLFDTYVGITGFAELADLDGPFLKLRLQGRFCYQKIICVSLPETLSTESYS